MNDCVDPSPVIKRYRMISFNSQFARIRGSVTTLAKIHFRLPCWETVSALLSVWSKMNNFMLWHWPHDRKMVTLSFNLLKWHLFSPSVELWTLLQCRSTTAAPCRPKQTTSRRHKDLECQLNNHQTEVRNHCHERLKSLLTHVTWTQGTRLPFDIMDKQQNQQGDQEEGEVKRLMFSQTRVISAPWRANGSHIDSLSLFPCSPNQSTASRQPTTSALLKWWMDVRENGDITGASGLQRHIPLIPLGALCN